MKTATRASALIARTEGNDAAADFLADAVDVVWISEPHAWSFAAEGLRYIGDRRDTTWARLMAHDVQPLRPGSSSSATP